MKDKIIKIKIFRNVLQCIKIKSIANPCASITGLMMTYILYTRLKLIARQLTIVSSVFCVTGYTDTHYECYTNEDGPYNDYYFHSLALEFI